MTGSDMNKIEQNAVAIRNDMDLIHASLKVFDKQMSFRLFTAASETVTIFDIMLYNEISQTLFMLDHFKQTSKCQLYRGAGTNEELLNYENLNKWYTRTMTSNEKVFDALKKYDGQMRDVI